MYDAESRREFLRKALSFGGAIGFTGVAANALSAATLPARPRPGSPNERLNLGVIGVQGRGARNLASVAGENIVALCDIDKRHLAAAKKLHPKATTTDDFRRLLEIKNLDGIVISTPDHMHAIPASGALRQGIHVYCEKPLAHSVHEVQTMRRLAAANKCVTQMGTQIHALDNYRRVVEIVRAGLLGPVRRVHVWMDGVPKVGKRVTSGTPPSHVNYDLWLGPAPERPFHPTHFHFDWRYWWDFGGGVLADFGCHFMDLPHWALGLRAPTTIEAEGKKNHDGDNQVPGLLRVEYQYPARGKLPPVHLTWYHGGWKPKGAEKYNLPSAVLFEGDNGRLVSNYNEHRYELKDGTTTIPNLEEKVERIPSSIGHHKEWLEAIRTGGTTSCNFDYSGALAESVLLGNVAYRSGASLSWDGERGEVTNGAAAKAAEFIQRRYRKGWKLS